MLQIRKFAEFVNNLRPESMTQGNLERTIGHDIVLADRTTSRKSI